jgi:hypothetical protein
MIMVGIRETPAPEMARAELSYWDRDIVDRLTERAAVARSEGTGTAMGDAVHFEEAANMIRSMRADKHSGGGCEALEAFNKLIQYGARSHWAGGLQAADGTVFRFDDRSAFFLSDADRDCIKSSLTGAGWQDISTEPKGGHLAHWVADPRGYMEPVHEKYGRWRNCYSGLYLTWAPTLWMPLPEAPVGSGRTLADANPTTPQPILYGAPKEEEG